jgi:hypothetical protein
MNDDSLGSVTDEAKALAAEKRAADFGQFVTA